MADPDNLALQSWHALTGDRTRTRQTSDLAEQIARREEIANGQRIHLFRFIVGIVCISIVVVGAFVAFLGLEIIKIETGVAVAFISAMAVQSFVLIGLLVRGLFMAARPTAAPTVE